MQIPETEIIVTKDGREVLRKTVRPGDYVIGRDAECEVHVEVDRVSGRHAQLTVNFDHVLIEDLGSDSGTQVNGKAVTEPTRLWPNQKIQIGAATVELHRSKAAPAPDVSLAPSTATVQRLLPEEFLREKRYDIGGVVAQGGMGAILDARETTTERTVAMKVMLDGSNTDDLTRFVAEAKVTAQLEHPNIVPVHELGVDENEQVYYTMKFVKGVTLKKVLEQIAEGDAEMMKKYPLPVLLTIFQKVCDAIGFAHSKGVIHRDLKPENIMLGDFGEVQVMDWGLAKRMGRDPGRDGSPSRPGALGESALPAADDGSGSRTISGSIMGTPQYMSPEQAEGLIEEMDARSDIFSLGGVLYAVLTLRPPVEGKTLDEVLQKVRDGNITPPSAFDGATRQGKVTVRGGGVKAQQTAPTPVEGETFDETAPTLVVDGSGAPPAPVAAAGQGAPAAKSAVLEARKIKPLPHIPGGRVPAALSAVTMKALSLKKEDRYQTVVEFSADLAAYQNGFATKAEHASFMQQILLLIRRNKGVFVTGFAAWFVFLLRTPGPQTEQAAVFKPTSTLSLLRLNATGNRLAAVQSFNTGAFVYAPATGTQPVKLDHKDMKRIWDLGWLGGGQRLVGLVTAKAERGDPGSEEWIVLWDAATGKVVQTVNNRTAMDVLAVAPDGTRFAEAGADKMVRIRDATTLAVQQEFRAHDGPITALAWHPSKPILATASADLSVKLWNLETGRRLEELRGMVSAPDALAFSPSGQRLGCAGKDGTTRIWEPQSLNEKPAADKAADGWEDLLAPLTPAAIMRIGNGWRLENGALFSPNKLYATLPLPGNLSGTSYQVRVKLRQLTAKDSFHLDLPVADRMVGFGLDEWPKDGFYTGLSQVDGKLLKNGPGAVHGKQVKDSEQHDLEVTVRPDGANATITATLDGQPLYEWTGPTAALSEFEKWVAPPGTLALGARAADWVVYEVKVKRLEK